MFPHVNVSVMSHLLVFRITISKILLVSVVLPYFYTSMVEEKKSVMKTGETLLHKDV